MIPTLYSATGCARCNITKNYMKENGIDFDVLDIKADGKSAFAKFYRANRKDIFRGKDGVEFPVYTDGRVIRQGVSVVIGYLVAGDRLSGFIGRSRLHGEWLDGINVSGGPPEGTEDLLTVMAYLKKAGLKLEVTTDGRNSAIFEKVMENGLADRAVVEVRGPASLYSILTGDGMDEDDLKNSLTIAARFPEYRFFTTIIPFRSEGALRFLTPEEIGETAKLIEAATGSKKHPYLLRAWNPETESRDDLKEMSPLESSALFKYRTMARRYMVMTDIEK